MLLCLAVIIDTDKQKAVSILCHPVRILFTTYLVYGRVSILVAFKFKDDGRRINIFSWNKYNIGKTFTCRQFAVHHIVVLCIIVSNTQYASQRIFIVI